MLCRGSPGLKLKQELKIEFKSDVKNDFVYQLARRDESVESQREVHPMHLHTTHTSGRQLHGMHRPHGVPWLAAPGAAPAACQGPRLVHPRSNKRVAALGWLVDTAEQLRGQLAALG